MENLKARDIRVGNYVLANNPIYRKDEFDKFLNILAINEDSATVTVIEDGKPIGYTFGQLYKYIEPIPLTEDILLKCGFEYQKDENLWWTTKQSNEFNIKIEDSELKKTEKVVWVYFENCPEHPITCVFELHQLQNLYFALTNEELTIKL